MKPMKIKKYKIDALIPAAYNPRKDLKPGDAEYEKIKRSIQEFGYVDPIIVNERNNVVVGGHQRLKVLRDLGVKTVEASCVDLDDAREKALNIALNKIAGEWDDAALALLLDELKMTDFDLDLTGFDEVEIGVLMGGIIPKNNKEINEEAMKEIKNNCPKCGFQW